MKSTRILACCVAGLLAVACQGQTKQQEAQGAMSEQGSAAGGMSGQQGGMQSVSMSPKNDSGITGMAEFSPAGSDSVTITVTLHGVEQGKTYPTHVHHGSCDSPGAVAQPLNSVTVESDSTGSSATTVAHSIFMADSSYFVQSHLPDGTPAACGDLPSMPHGGAMGGGMSDSSSMGGSSDTSSMGGGGSV